MALARDLGDGAGHLDAGRPAADDDEGEQRGARSASSSVSSARSKASSSRRRIVGRVLDAS